MKLPRGTNLNPVCSRILPLLHCGLLALLLAPLVSHGQTAANYIEKLTVDDGLSGQKVTDVVQDDRGFLWIATTNGLNRYDGSEIVQYLADGTEHSLPDNGVNCLLPTHSGKLLLGTDQGIAVLDLNTDSFHTVQLAPLERHTPYADQVQLLIQDLTGRYWACTPSSVYRLDSDLVVLDVFTIRDKPMASRFLNVYKVVPLPSGEVLFWVYDGAYHWSPHGKELLPMATGQGSLFRFLQGSPYYKTGLIANKYLIKLTGADLAVLDLSNGRSSTMPLPVPPAPFSICGTWGHSFAVGSETSGGAIYTLDSTGTHVSLDRRSVGLMTKYTVPKVLADDEGNLWVISSYQELKKIAKNKQRFHRAALFAEGTDSVPAKEVVGISPYGSKVLVSTFGDGYFLMDPATGEQRQFSVRIDSSSENIVWHFHFFGKDTLWIGTQQGIVYHIKGRHEWGRLPMLHPGLLDSVPITTMFTDSRHWTWMGLGRGNGVAVYDAVRNTFRLFPYATGEFPFRYPLQAGEDTLGNVWFISDVTGDLVQWDHRTGLFNKVVVPGVHGDIHHQTGGLYVDKRKGLIWYGVQPIGLVQYRIGQGTSRVFNVKNGLTTGMITGITADKHSRLWLGTTQGISCFDPAQEKAINYARSDGLPGSNYTSKLFYDSTLNRIYAGSPGMLTWFTVPEKLVDDQPMRIYLTDLKVNGHPAKYSLHGQMELGPDQNNLYVKFSAINLSDGNKNRYQYRLNEDQWTDLGKQSEIRLASLNPGNYALEVRAAHKQGSFGPGRTLLHVSIHPYFTDTFWFYLVCLVVAASLIFAWYRYRLGNLRRIEGMRTRISRDLHDEIGSRLTNINMMSQIIRQGPARQKEEALLGKIQEESEEISRSMREIIWDIAPQNDHLGVAMPRMLSFASQLLESKGIEVQAFIGELDDLSLDMAMRRDLFLIFKEAVHNIVKHSAATKAVIRASVQGGRFQLRIEDNGRGLGQQPNFHESGLRYMKQRAESHGWKLEISGNLDAGTAVSLRIPGT